MDKFMTRYMGTDPATVAGGNVFGLTAVDGFAPFNRVIDSIPTPGQLMPWSFVDETTFLPGGINYTPDPDFDWLETETNNETAFAQLNAIAAGVDHNDMLWYDAFPADVKTRGWEADDDLLDQWQEEQIAREKALADAAEAAAKAEAEKQPDEDWSGEPTKYYHRGPIEMINPDWTEWRKQNPNAPSQFDKPEDKPEEEPEPTDKTTVDQGPTGDPDATDQFFDDMFGGFDDFQEGDELDGEGDGEGEGDEFDPWAWGRDPTDEPPELHYDYDTEDAPDPDEPPELTTFADYLLHEHFSEFQKVASGEIDIEDLKKKYPVGASGEFVIGGDPELEKKLDLPEEIRAVQVGDKIVKQYDPYAVRLKPHMGETVHDATHTVI
jgi:hypothetical protein